MSRLLVPTLFATSKEEFLEKLDKLSFANIIHLDVMDGEFVSSKSLQIRDIVDITSNFDKLFEMHLMVKFPNLYLNKLKGSNISKVLFHLEAFHKKEELLETINSYHKENFSVFLVLKPQTQTEEVIPYLNSIEGVMIMSVEPGKEGQEFVRSSLEKIKLIKSLSPHTLVQLDGGLNKKTIIDAKKAGCDIFSVGSAISSQNSPEKSYKELDLLL